MKSFITIIALLFLLSTTNVAFSQIDKAAIMGAWKAELKDEAGNQFTGVGIIADGFFSVAKFNMDEKKFISTLGGSWKLDGNMLKETIEYHTADKSKVGSNISSEIKMEGNTLTFVESGETWTKIDDGQPGDLFGAWLITGRDRDGQMNEIQEGPRKTMKILSGTRFQWIAYNTATGAFFGTGGGTYTTKDGKYVENIEFFSRDGSRVGASLGFSFALKDGDWHHKGKSSKGNPIYEIWSLR
ncbi:membrane or secreted protein [Fulvivirgaceae bacterium BMA10]|uniref:Membrane or secreted protein n=1 Tax=Splendidivirga corallicola TaxID=3051826 RepID=A0ABT8KSC8_9BACT|nr:membrane or secreted protein [Fulvivirgaceae bacterium BMA10]